MDYRSDTMRRVWIGLVMLAVVGSAGVWWAMRGNRAERMLGSQFLTIIDHPDAVRVYRLRSDLSEAELENVRKNDPRSLFMAGCQIVGRGSDPAPETVRRLGRLLHDDFSYAWAMGTKACLPQPGVGIRFEKGGRTADVALCFQCNMWGFALDRRYIGEANFDSVRRDLVGIAQRAFPDDVKIRSLKPDVVEAGS